MNSIVRGIGTVVVAGSVLVLAVWSSGTDRALQARPRGPVELAEENEFAQAERTAAEALCQPPATAAPLEYDPQLIRALVDEARARGNSRRGAMLFGSPHFACVSCHRVGQQGGTTGPELTTVGKMQTPEQIVESFLWPKRQVKPEFIAHLVATSDGKQYQGYKESESKTELVLRDPALGGKTVIPLADIEERREIGTLMPDGLAAAMTPAERRDIVRFLLDLGHDATLAGLVRPLSHDAPIFPYVHGPLHPADWPNRRHYVNRDRLYDFYAKEAEYFLQQPALPLLLPEYPGLDGGSFGHWGNQNEETWADNRWNATDLGWLLSGIFRGGNVTVPKGVCMRLGDRQELSACFNPQTLQYDMVWSGGFVRFSPVRHGFMDGLLMDGQPVAVEKTTRPAGDFVYHGFYRLGNRVVFAYRIANVEYLDSPWVEQGKFVRTVARADAHPLAGALRSAPRQWPQVLETQGKPGTGSPYAVDRIGIPFDNPWRVQMFFSGHGFSKDGTAYVCTMQGDVWKVTGLDERLEHVEWRRFASGLSHALGLVVADERIYVVGRDQITELSDLNGDGEADFYRCVSNAYQTSPAAHDFICGLERDAAGNFYTASGNQGLIRVSPNGRDVEVLATGFRNPDGLGLLPDGAITVPCSEGEWTPTSEICLVEPGKTPSGAAPPHFGYPGPKGNQPPAFPFLYLPRGVDNSSGGQTIVDSDRWGLLQGQIIHTSNGTATHLLLLRDEVEGQPQGAAVPLVGDFSATIHRARFNPHDGQLYVTGMAGWGGYNVQDGAFDRVRYTGAPVQLPSAFHVHENGILLKFTRPVDRQFAGRIERQFAQAWNYRYSAAYGSSEFSPRHRGMPGHDPLEITSIQIAPGEQEIFLEIPDIQPVNQLHLHLRVDEGRPHDLFLTVNKLDRPYTSFPNYRPVQKTIAAHPLLVDLANTVKPVPNPWQKPLADAREIRVEAGKNLTYATRSLKARAGEPLKMTFVNPDVVPHNWVLVKPGALERVGTLANKIIADPDAVARHYVPKTNDVLYYCDVVTPGEEFSIYFQAPEQPGRYPFLCSFPGHWMVMNGQLLVE
ncbi:MAG: c-type cytochrome [Planctomycetes bacterium]|nr:c-type cytochrome [Planctomycetota bacterium]